MEMLSHRTDGKTSTWCANCLAAASLQIQYSTSICVKGLQCVHSSSVWIIRLNCVQLLMKLHLTATECHLSYGIT